MWRRTSTQLNGWIARSDPETEAFVSLLLKPSEISWISLLTLLCQIVRKLDENASRLRCQAFLNRKEFFLWKNSEPRLKFKDKLLRLVDVHHHESWFALKFHTNKNKSIKKAKQESQNLLFPLERLLNSINYLLSNNVIKCTIYKLLSIYINIAHLCRNAQHWASSYFSSSCSYFLSCRLLFFFVFLSHWVP